MAGAYAQRFSAVAAQVGARAEPVVVDAVAVVEPAGGVAHHHQGGAGIGLAHQLIVVEAVVLAVHPHPVVRLLAVRLVVAVDHHAGHAAVVGPFLRRGAEGDHLAARRPAIAEHQVGDFQIGPGQPQLRLPAQDHLPRRLRGQSNWLTNCPGPRQQQIHIPPHPIRQDHGIARFQALGGSSVPSGIMHQILRRPGNARQERQRQPR
ncbi:hypothetical protein D9M71_584610 [compost metagenome]